MPRTNTDGIYPGHSGKVIAIFYGLALPMVYNLLATTGGGFFLFFGP